MILKSHAKKNDGTHRERPRWKQKKRKHRRSSNIHTTSTGVKAINTKQTNNFFLLLLGVVPNRSRVERDRLCFYPYNSSSSSFCFCTERENERTLQVLCTWGRVHVWKKKGRSHASTSSSSYFKSVEEPPSRGKRVRRKRISIVQKLFLLSREMWKMKSNFFCCCWFRLQWRMRIISCVILPLTSPSLTTIPDIILHTE